MDVVVECLNYTTFSVNEPASWAAQVLPDLQGTGVTVVLIWDIVHAAVAFYYMKNYDDVSTKPLHLTSQITAKAGKFDELTNEVLQRIFEGL